MGTAEMIEVACEVRRVRDKVVAVADGATFTGEGGREIEKWYWLPKSQIEVNADGTVSMPEWLALDRGLI